MISGCFEFPFFLNNRIKFKTAVYQDVFPCLFRVIGLEHPVDAELVRKIAVNSEKCLFQ